jgi:hypothetical protein
VSWSVNGDGRNGSGSFTYTGGTGKYKEIKGTNSFTTLLQVNWPDGTTTGVSTWNR